MKKIRSIALGLASVIGVMAALGACYHLGVAHAANAAAAAADPVGTANLAADSGWDVVAHQGPLLGALLLASALFRQFLKANESKHWIAQGKTLAILTGIGMVIGAAVDWKWNGGPAAGIITALFAAIPLIMHSTVRSAPAAPPAASSAASGAGATALLLIMAGALALQPACATVKAAPGAAKTAVVECAKADSAPIINALAEFAATAALSALNHQAIDWGGIEATAKAHGLVVGGCALTRFVAEIERAPKPETAARALVAGPDPAADGRAALVRLSARFDGATWSVQ